MGQAILDNTLPTITFLEVICKDLVSHFFGYLLFSLGTYGKFCAFKMWYFVKNVLFSIKITHILKKKCKNATNIFRNNPDEGLNQILPDFPYFPKKIMNFSDFWEIPIWPKKR